MEPLNALRKEAGQNTLSRLSATREAENLIEAAIKEFLLVQKQAPLLKDFNSVEPLFESEMGVAFKLIEAEYPVEMHAQLKKLVEKLFNRNLHLSREHLKSVLRNVVSNEVRV